MEIFSKFGATRNGWSGKDASILGDGEEVDEQGLPSYG
jgi:hypothetical protein